MNEQEKFILWYETSGVPKSFHDADRYLEYKELNLRCGDCGEMDDNGCYDSCRGGLECKDYDWKINQVITM